MFLPCFCLTGVAQVRHVSPTGNNVTGCGTSGNPCQTLQYTLNNVVADGDTVYLQSGTYALPNTVPGGTPVAFLPLGVSLTFQGDTTGSGAILDGDNLRQLFRYDYLTICPGAGSPPTTPDTVQFNFFNLTLQNGLDEGKTCGSTTHARGGAMQFFNNSGSSLRVEIESCVFLNNRANDLAGPNIGGRSASGGAIYFFGLRRNNLTTTSTGAYLQVNQCVFSGNAGNQGPNGGHGGAIATSQMDEVLILGSTFCNNSVTGVTTDAGDMQRDRNAGGALLFFETEVRTPANNLIVQECAFFNNSATTVNGATLPDQSEGGAIFLHRGDILTNTNNAFLGIYGSHFFNNTIETGIEHVDNNSGNLFLGQAFPNTFNVNPVDLGPDSLICGSGFWKSVSPLPQATYNWSTGSDSSSILINGPGTYWVEVSWAGGCVFSDTIEYILGNSISSSTDTTICQAQSFTLSAPPNMQNPVWNNGTPGPVITANGSGVYYVSGTHTSGCTWRDTTVVIAYPPVGLDLGPDFTVCGQGTSVFQANGYLSYLWSDGSTNYAYVSTSTDTIWLTVGDTNNCVGSDTVIVAYGAGGIDLGPDSIGCAGDAPPTFSFPSSVWDTLLWSNGSTGTALTPNPPFTIWIEATDTVGCKYSDTVSWSLINPPTLNLGPDVLLCSGQSVDFIVPLQPDWSLVWSDGDTANPLTVSTTQTLIGAVSNVCATVVDTVDVEVIGLTSSVLGPDTSYCPDSGALVLQPSFSGSSYLWSDGSTNNSLTVSGFGTFGVTVTDANGCSTTDQLTATENCPLSVYLPNAFSPNGDDLNDVFVPLGRGLAEYHFQVFNRWGELVFESRNPEEGWNGQFLNQEAPVGVYVWVLTYKGRRAATVRQRGHLTLVR
ncbi:MAG: gliding motility-associated C-terminal domain-containing protein [Salibacteraceae bacterium]